MNFEKITEYLDSLEASGIPSVDCMICRDHKVLYRHLNGWTDTEKTKKVREDQLYLMFSMTKIQTMTAVMQLVEQGRISLEDEVGKYLPAYGKLQVENAASGGDGGQNAVPAASGTDGGQNAVPAASGADGGQSVVPAATPLKIKYLLSMQSGLDYNLERPGIKRVLAEKGMKATTREIVDAFAESPLKFNPGEHFLYSLSHDVAAAIVEVVSGMSFGEYLRENIWKPLGMKDTFFAKPVNCNERLAQQYIFDGNAGRIVPMEPTCNYQLSECYESGGAGLISCTNDYSLLGDAIACGGIGANGARILKSETVEIIKQNLLGEASLEDISKGMGRVGYGYGCGMQVLMKPELIGSPAPAGVFGWDGAAGSCLIMDTASKTSLVYTMHVRNYGPAYSVIHPRLRDFLFED